MSKKEMVQTAPQQLAPVADYGADAGAGFENQGREDISIPFLSLLQANSPEISEIEAAKPGMLFNTVTRELAKEVTIVPATTRHQFVEWVPRDKGGGFVQARTASDPDVQAAIGASKSFGDYMLPNGNELVETFYVYAVVLDAEGQPNGFVTIGFTSTKIKVYKNWNTTIRMFQVKTSDGRKIAPPLFAHTVKVSSKPDKNAKGVFANFSLTPAKGTLAESLLPPDHPAFLAAKELRTMVDQGLAKAAYESQTTPAEGAKDPDWNV